MTTRRFSLLLIAAAFPWRAFAADVVRPIGEGRPLIAPVTENRTLPGVQTAVGPVVVPALAVPSAATNVPEAPSPDVPAAAAMQPPAQDAAPVRQALDQFSQTLAPEGAPSEPAGAIEAGRQAFDGQGRLSGDAVSSERRESIVHLHHDGQDTHAHFESYHRDHEGDPAGQNFARPMSIPARLAPYVPSARAKNPQDWSGRDTLHLHSVYSDGTMTPEDVIEAAYKKGVRVVALTDHDTSAGILRAFKKVRQINEANPADPMEFHTGVEMTARGGAHIGAIDVDVTNPKLVALLERVRIARYHKAKGMIDNLNALDELKQKGITLTIDEVKAFSQHDAGGTIEIPHIARALVSRGLIEHVDDAYDTYLKGDIFSVPGVAADPTVEEVVETIHDAGGKAFLNHPYTVRGKSDAEKDAAVEEMLALGMDGIEVYRPSHATSDNGKRQADERAAKYLLWAEKYDLMAGNGADFHGMDTHLDQLQVWMHKDLAAKLERGLKDANQKAIAALERLERQPPAPAKSLARLLFVPPVLELPTLAQVAGWAQAHPVLAWLSGAFALALALYGLAWVVGRFKLKFGSGGKKRR